MKFIGLNIYYLIIGLVINFIVLKSFGFLMVLGLNLSQIWLIFFEDSNNLKTFKKI
jgi:hypothetical protein